MYTGEFVPHLRRAHEERLRRAHHRRRARPERLAADLDADLDRGWSERER